MQTRVTVDTYAAALAVLKNPGARLVSWPHEMLQPLRIVIVITH